MNAKINIIQMRTIAEKAEKYDFERIEAVTYICSQHYKGEKLGKRKLTLSTKSVPGIKSGLQKST